MISKILENFRNKVYSTENGRKLFELDLNDLVDEVQTQYQDEIQYLEKQVKDLEQEIEELEEQKEDEVWI